MTKTNAKNKHLVSHSILWSNISVNSPLNFKWRTIYNNPFKLIVCLFHRTWVLMSCLSAFKTSTRTFQTACTHTSKVHLSFPHLYYSNTGTLRISWSRGLMIKLLVTMKKKEHTFLSESSPKGRPWITHLLFSRLCPCWPQGRRSA